MLNMKRVPIDKVCKSCQRLHLNVGDDLKFFHGDIGGVQWNCECGSTLFLSDEEIAQAIKNLADFAKAVA